MAKIIEIITYLKENKEVAEILNKQCNLNLMDILATDYNELPSNKKRDLQDEFIKMGLMDKDSVERERRSNVRVDDIPSYYYNYEYKQSYLEEHTSYKEETKRVLRVFFRKIADMEKELGKDFYDFNGMEIEKAIKSIRATTVRSLQNTISMLGKYTDYSIEIGIASVKENLVYNFSSQEKASRLIDKESNERMYLTRDDVMSMAMESINAQDGVILALLHDGFSHKDNFKEIVNLRVEDVDLERKIATIKSRGVNNNIISLSDETVFLLKHAINNPTYVSTKTDSDVYREYTIPETAYVIRGLRAKDSSSKISWRNINQRILRLAEFFENEFLTASNIVSSSQIDTACELYLDDKAKGDRAIQLALEKFNFPYNKSSLFSLKKKVDMYKGVHII